MNSKQVFGMGAHPLTLDNGSASNQTNERGRHETGIQRGLPTRCANRPKHVRGSHDSEPAWALPGDSLQRGTGNVVWLSSAAPACGRKKPRADVVCAAIGRAVHAASGQNRAVWISASTCISKRSTRSNWLSFGAAGCCSNSQPMGSWRGSTMCGLRSGGLGFASDLEVGPLLLPVMWAQLLARHLPAEMLFEGVAVVRGEWAQAVRPVPHVAAVWIPENPRHFGMVVSRQGQDFLVCFDLHKTEV